MIIKGQKINDRYQIIRTIGEGGMANVYLAYDTILDRNVAVKILRGDLAEDEKFVRRFQREAIAASSLTHPNIVEMYDVGEDDGKYFIVMEYVEGITLKNLIKRRGALTIPEVLDIMLQLTSGIACAHESYIIHRDIKPQNVLILDDGRVKITDFGIAMALNSNELTQTNSVMGSVHYLPPEQANGTGATIQSDIYSLGILMYELITGKLPFKGDSAVEVALKHMKQSIPSIVEQNDNIPQSVENIILKASAKNPKNRYENAMQMHDDIKTCLDEDRKNEEKYVYEFPEFEDEKTVKKVSRAEKNNIKQEEIEKDIKEEKKDKKKNKIILISSIIASIIVLALITVIFILPILTAKKEVTIPDVTNMKEEEAIKTLQDLGLKIAEENIEKNSDDVELGLVISTSPKKGRTVKEGTIVTLTLSLGSESMELEDYTGKNYEVVKQLLEAKGLIVNIEEKEYTKDDNMKEGEVVEQSIKAGTSTSKGDTITIYYAKIIPTYPDFVSENYTKEQAEDFCDDYEVNCVFTQKVDEKADEGTIIYQSRSAGTKVVSGVTLRLTVAKAPEKITTSSSTKEASTSSTKATTATTTKSSTTTSAATISSTTTIE